MHPLPQKMNLILQRTGELVGENSDGEKFMYLFKRETKIEVWLTSQAKTSFISLTLSLTILA